MGKFKEVYTQTHEFQNGENQKQRKNLKIIQRK